MKEEKYDVQLLLPDGQTYYTVCTAESIDGLIAVLRAIFDCHQGSPGQLLIVKRAMV